MLQDSKNLCYNEQFEQSLLYSTADAWPMFASPIVRESEGKDIFLTRVQKH